MPRLITLASALLFPAIPFAAALGQMSPLTSPIPGIEHQCVLNHPFQAEMDITLTGGLDNKTPLNVTMPGEILRDSEGRQRMVMNMQMPDQKDSHQMIMLFDPPAGKIVVLMPEIKKMMKREMPQVHCAPTAGEPDFSDITKQGATVTPLGTKDFGELHATGYGFTFNVPAEKGKPPQTATMEFWTDLYQSIPVKLTMKVGDAFAMNMDFSKVKLVEPAVAQFAVPEGYTEMSIPAQPADPKAPATH